MYFKKVYQHTNNEKYVQRNTNWWKFMYNQRKCWNGEMMVVYIFVYINK